MTLVSGLNHEIVSVLETVGVETFSRPLHLLGTLCSPVVLVIVPQSHTPSKHWKLSSQLCLEGPDSLPDGDHDDPLLLPPPDPHPEHGAGTEVDLHQGLQVAVDTDQLGPPANTLIG